MTERRVESHRIATQALTLGATVLVTLVVPLFLYEHSYSCTRNGCDYDGSAFGVPMVIVLVASVAAAVIATRRWGFRRIGLAVAAGLCVSLVCFVTYLFLLATTMG